MNFQQKYLKYKSKYTQLKNQLKGGACNPVPVPTDREHISLDEYQNIPAARLETIGGHCYDIVELANWIHISANPTYPATGLPMSLNDIWRVITAYNTYRVANLAANPDLPNHFIFTPAQSAQIIVALSNPPVTLAITNLIKNIRRPPVVAPPIVVPPIVAPPIVVHPGVINATPAQRLLFNGIIPVLPAAFVPGTRYIGYDLQFNRYTRTLPFINFYPGNGWAGFGNHHGIIYDNPALFRYYNDADLMAVGIPLPP